MNTYLVTISNGSGLDSDVLYEDELEAETREAAEANALAALIGSLEVEVCGPFDDDDFDPSDDEVEARGRG